MHQLTLYNQISSLKQNKIMGHCAPHKPILLLSIMDLVAHGTITDNKVTLSEQLIKQFAHNWDRHVGESIIFKCAIDKPFWHLQNEPFWQLIHTDGYRITKANSPQAIYGIAKLQRTIHHAIIDPELFEMMRLPNHRIKLEQIILSTYLTDNELPCVAEITPLLITIGSTLLTAAS